MFVDSHTWDPVLPLLPQGRRYALVDPPGLGLASPCASQRHRRRRRRCHRPARRARRRRPGRLGRQRLRRARRVQARRAARPAPQSRGRQLTGPAGRRPAAPADHAPAPDPSDGGSRGPVRTAILTAMLTDASATRAPLRRMVVESLARPTRRSMALAVRSFILNRVDVTAELADLTVPSLFVASDDRGDWSPQDAEAAAVAPDAAAVTVGAPAPWSRWSSLRPWPPTSAGSGTGSRDRRPPDQGTRSGGSGPRGSGAEPPLRFTW